MELLYAIEEYDEEAGKWAVMEHPDPEMRNFSPAIVYKTLDSAVESICMCINAHATDEFGKELEPQEPLIKKKLRINFYRDCTKQDGGYHTSNLQQWMDFGEITIHEQRQWAQKHYDWVQSERARETGYSDN